VRASATAALGAEISEQLMILRHHIDGVFGNLDHQIFTSNFCLA
jgi:hypothetical protein